MRVNQNKRHIFLFQCIYIIISLYIHCFLIVISLSLIAIHRPALVSYCNSIDYIGISLAAIDPFRCIYPLYPIEFRKTNSLITIAFASENNLISNCI